MLERIRSMPKPQNQDVWSKWANTDNTDMGPESAGTAGLSLRSPQYFFVQDSPQRPPTATNRQPPIINRQPPITNRQPPTANV